MSWRLIETIEELKTMPEKLDTTQPLAYRGDDTRQVRILCSDAKGAYPVISQFINGDDWIRQHRPDGSCHANQLTQFDLVPLRFRVTEPGVYRTRKGYEFHALCTDAPGIYPVIGYVVGLDGNAIPSHRTLEGKASFGCQLQRDCDLVERIKP